MFKSIENGDPILLRIDAASLDRANALEFRALAESVVKADGGRVEVDCSKLEFIDSSGVGALLYVNNLLPEERRPVRLTGVGGNVLSVLELVRVHRLFEVEGK